MTNLRYSLEGLDTNKIKDWRGQHPNRFHCTKREAVENHYDPRNTTGAFTRSGPIKRATPATMNAIEQKKSKYFNELVTDTCMNLGLKEILEQNNLYDEVLSQINGRLSVRDQMRESKQNY